MTSVRFAHPKVQSLVPTPLVSNTFDTCAPNGIGIVNQATFESIFGSNTFGPIPLVPIPYPKVL